jgi:hypothetical protein
VYKTGPIPNLVEFMVFIFSAVKLSTCTFSQRIHLSIKSKSVSRNDWMTWLVMYYTYIKMSNIFIQLCISSLYWLQLGNENRYTIINIFCNTLSPSKTQSYKPINIPRRRDVPYNMTINCYYIKPSINIYHGCMFLFDALGNITRLREDFFALS